MVRRPTVRNTLLTIAVILLMAFAVAMIPQTVHADDTWNVKSVEFTPASPTVNMSVIMERDNDGIYALNLANRYKKGMSNCFFKPGDKCVVTYNDSSTKEFEFSRIKGVGYAEFKSVVGNETINLEALNTDNAKELKMSGEVSVDELAAIIGENGVSIEYGEYWEEGDEIVGHCVYTHTFLNVYEDTVHDHKTAIRTRNETPAQCEATGMARTAHYCQICGKYFEDTEATVEIDKADLIIPITHTWNDGEVTKAATCKEAGNKHFVCTKCGEEKDEEIPAGHKWKSSYTVDKKATYAAAGSKSIHCSVCNAVKPGSKKTIAKLVVKATAISKLTAGKKSFTVKWKKASGVSGYQIQYALNRNLSKGRKTVKVAKGTTVSKTIKKLKGKKTYYVRVRSYKTVSGKTYYSKWSGIKTVKTKR